MLLAKARKMSHHIVGPLVLLWLLCQSMVLCAGLMGNDARSTTFIASALSSSKVAMPAVMDGHHSGEQHGMAMPLVGADQSHHHSPTNELASADCCDEQESYLSNSFFSSIVFLLLFPLYWLIVSLRQRLKHSTYHREPPPLYNYPRNHVFNCTFLN